MTVTLYRNGSDVNVVDKQLTEMANYTGTLREESSVIAPVIVIADSTSTIVSCNYLYIPDWNRYYFIEDITSVRTGIWEVRARVDVLMSFRSGIRACSGIIARQENLYNLYLDDDKFLVNAPRMVTQKAFPNRVETGGTQFVMLMGGLRPKTE